MLTDTTLRSLRPTATAYNVSDRDEFTPRDYAKPLWAILMTFDEP